MAYASVISPFNDVCTSLSMRCQVGAREPPARARRWPIDPDAAEPSSAATGVPSGCSSVKVLWGFPVLQIRVVCHDGERKFCPS